MAEHEQDQLWVYNPTQTKFTVSWGGFPYSVESGEKRIFPRFIAEHYAKHLADAILLRKEEKEKDETGKYRPLVNHPVLRPKIVSMILLGVYSQFRQNKEDPGAIIANMVAQQNQGLDQSQAPKTEDAKAYEDFGLIPNKAIGQLAPPPDPDVEAPLPPAETNDEQPSGELLPDVPGTNNTPQVTDAAKKQPRTRKELMEEAEALGITGFRRMTSPQLEEAIRNF